MSMDGRGIFGLKVNAIVLVEPGETVKVVSSSLVKNVVFVNFSLSWADIVPEVAGRLVSYFLILIQTIHKKTDKIVPSIDEFRIIMTKI